MDVHLQQHQQQQQHHNPPPNSLTGPDNLPTGGMSLANEQEVVRRAGRQAISAFLDAHNCFSVIRNSGKVVVFDTRIPIQLAFYALVEHDMQVAPLWDPTVCQFVGLLKVTDFIDILRHYRATNANVASLATRSIAEMFQDPSLKEAVGVHWGFACADSSTTLKQACYMLLQQPQQQTTTTTTSTTASTTTTTTSSSSSSNKKKINRCGDFLPVVMPEDMRVLACITYTNILEHLVTHFREQRRLFDDSIYDLRIGTYHDQLVTVGPHETLAHALELMHTHGLSALPVVVLEDGGEGSNTTTKKKLIGVYSRSDITFLTKATDAEDAVANLELTLKDVLDQQRTDVTTPDAMHTCGTSHTLQSIFEYFAQLKFNRLFVVDESGAGLVGVVSAKDLVAYFMNDN